jgi:uncharacterized protein
MNLKKIITYVCIAAMVTLAIYTPVLASRLGPKAVLEAVHAGIREIDGSRANPPMKWNVRNGTASACGPVGGSMYCPRNNTIYITQQHIKMAYQYGDAALAYILSHEYAHAVQTKSRLDMSNITRTELQADCLAGFFMGTIPNVEFDATDIQEIATQATALGDMEFNNDQHHGTPEERKSAVLKGFQASTVKNGIRACR